VSVERQQNSRNIWEVPMRSKILHRRIPSFTNDSHMPYVSVKKEYKKPKETMEVQVITPTVV
jgi:hypothetical protein